MSGVLVPEIVESTGALVPGEAGARLQGLVTEWLLTCGGAETRKAYGGYFREFCGRFALEIRPGNHLALHNNFADFALRNEEVVGPLPDGLVGNADNFQVDRRYRKTHADAFSIVGHGAGFTEHFTM